MAVAAAGLEPVIVVTAASVELIVLQNCESQ